jgi:hypothetical protein
MKKETDVFLFGAGAVMSWGAPSTSELTELVRRSGYLIKDESSTITDFIYQKLVANQPSANFETIINVIEELIIYYSKYGARKEFPSLQKIFFSASFEKEILNFEVLGNTTNPILQLSIPGVRQENAIYALNEETPAQFFLQLLLANILSMITGRVSAYAYHTRVLRKENERINSLFGDWMKAISSNKAMRLYTLNYDRVLKMLLEDSGISVFEGFDLKGVCVTGDRLRPNMMRIHSDFECNIHYNLHGSIFWEVMPRDQSLLPNPEIVLTPIPFIPLNSEQITIQIDKGKNVVFTNMVTGYQKSQKSFITPFRQMQSTFDRDCCLAEHIYIIGYSFGDEHINTSIKTALRYNDKVKITIVDPGFIQNNMDYEFALKVFPYKNNFTPDYKSPEENRYSYLGGQIEVFTLDFESYIMLASKQTL